MHVIRLVYIFLIRFKDNQSNYIFYDSELDAGRGFDKIHLKLPYNYL